MRVKELVKQYNKNFNPDYIPSSKLKELSEEIGLPLIRTYSPESQDCFRRLNDWDAQFCDELYKEDIKEYLLESTEYRAHLLGRKRTKYIIRLISELDLEIKKYEQKLEELNNEHK
jgi:hypothetical protein